MVDRMMRRVVQRGIIDEGQLHQVAHLHHAVGLEHVLALVEAEFRGEHAAMGRVHALGDFHPHDRREAAVAQFGLDQREQVVGFFLVALGIGIAGDAEKFA